MFTLAKDKTIGKAEALKQSMLAYMNTPAKPHLAHPADDYSKWSSFNATRSCHHSIIVKVSPSVWIQLSRRPKPAIILPLQSGWYMASAIF